MNLLRFVIILSAIIGCFCAITTKPIKKIVSKKPSNRNRTTQPTRVTLPKGANIFKTPNNTIATGQAGSLSVLRCHVINGANITVEWFKVGIERPLTKDNLTLTFDKRFLAKNDEETNNWYLRIRYTNESDRGRYMCRITGELSSELYASLLVIRAYATIIGQSKRKVTHGYPLRLSCLLKRSIEPPLYIFWFKNDEVINYDLKDGANVREGRQGSELIFPRAEFEDAGNYSCVPSNADQASVIVEIL